VLQVVVAEQSLEKQVLKNVSEEIFLALSGDVARSSMRARTIKYRRVFCRLLGAVERDTTIRGDIPKGRPLCCEGLALRCLDNAGGTPTKLLLYLAGVILSESL